MYTHEYMAKALLESYNIPVPKGGVVSKAEQASAIYSEIGSKRCIVKAQVHAGGRGKAGGVRAVESKASLIEAVSSMLGTNLVTYQTTAEGQPVHQVLLEEPCEIDRELYVAMTVDRSIAQIVCMVSSEGGVEIENVPHEKISRFTIDMLTGVMDYQCRQAAFKCNLKDSQLRQFCTIIKKLGRMFVENDFSMLEINPLVVDKSGQLICLDAKIDIDDNALYRHPKLVQLYDATQVDKRECEAKKHDLSYISLDGNIGCMVNGAGLAMATMDMIKFSQGHPANFLDVGGSVTTEQVKHAFEIIMADYKVKAVFINIFGGIVSCTTIADGIIAGLAEVKSDVPVIVRLEGNNAHESKEKLSNCGLNIIYETDFSKAAEKAVELAKKGEIS